MKITKYLLKEIKEDLNKWKDIPCSWIKRFNTVKMTVLANLIYRLKAVPIKILVSFFAEIDKLCLKLTWKCKDKNSENNPGKNKVGGLILANFKTYWKATICKRVWYWHKNRHSDQWDETESPNINPQIYS